MSDQTQGKKGMPEFVTKLFNPSTKKTWLKIVYLAVGLLLVLLLTNPSLMFFLPSDWRDAMKEGCRDGIWAIPSKRETATLSRPTLPAT